MIYHVVTTALWNEATEKGFYEAPSLQTEGFIHCSAQNQVKAVLERYYQHQQNLLLLHIDESLLIAELIYELAPSVNEKFPHIYGRINLDAVKQVTAISS